MRGQAWCSMVAHARCMVRAGGAGRTRTGRPGPRRPRRSPRTRTRRAARRGPRRRCSAPWPPSSPPSCGPAKPPPGTGCAQHSEPEPEPSASEHLLYCTVLYCTVQEDSCVLHRSAALDKCCRAVPDEFEHSNTRPRANRQRNTQAALERTVRRAHGHIRLERTRPDQSRTEHTSNSHQTLNRCASANAEWEYE